MTHLLLPCVAGAVRLIEALVSITSSSTGGTTSGASVSPAHTDLVSSAAAPMSRPVAGLPAPPPEPGFAGDPAAPAVGPGAPRCSSGAAHAEQAKVATAIQVYFSMRATFAWRNG